MARNKEYDRDTVLDAATQAFWTKGFKGTSMNDLVTATGLKQAQHVSGVQQQGRSVRECIGNFALKTAQEVNTILAWKPLGLGNIEAFFRNRDDYIMNLAPFLLDYRVYMDLKMIYLFYREI